MFSMTENSSYATISTITSNNDAFSLPGECNLDKTKASTQFYSFLFILTSSHDINDDVISRFEIYFPNKVYLWIV